jgi:hypothetical protein
MTIVKCAKCGIELNENWQEHHVWCKFMNNPHGNTWKEYANRLYLCEKCHFELHQMIIIPLLNDKTRALKFNGSEYWLWKKILPIDRELVIEEVCKETMRWINGKSI